MPTTPPRFARAVEIFHRTKDRPTLIIVDSIIGYGAPHKQNTAAAHSDALGAEEVKLAKRSYGWPEDAQFLVPDGVYECFHNGIGRRGRALREEWVNSFAAYQKQHPQAGREVEILLKGELPDNWDGELPAFPADEKGLAPREASGKVLNAIAKTVPWLIGGAGDLAPSTKTAFSGAEALEARRARRTRHAFRRARTRHGRHRQWPRALEAARFRRDVPYFQRLYAAIDPACRVDGIAGVPRLHPQLIGLGEDGPTHQPIEQLVALRAIPNIVVLRPADANEVREAYKVIMKLADRPACLVLSQQELPTFDRSRYASADSLTRGAYVLAGAEHSVPKVILIASGSEVQLCVTAYEQLKREGIAARRSQHAKLGAVRAAGSALSR